MRKWSMSWAAALTAAIAITGSHSFLLNLCKDENNSIPIDSAVLVLLQELSKLVVCMGFTRANEYRWRWHDLLYSVPALCYAFNNNVAIGLQSEMDPATFQILCNLKTVTTACFLYLLVDRRLPPTQWLAVFLVFLAGLLNSIAGLQHADSGWQNRHAYVTAHGLAMMLLYCSISGFSSVYSEKIMKQHMSESIWSQGVRMYAWGAMFNTLKLLFSQGRALAEPWIAMQSLAGLPAMAWIVVLTQALNGLLFASILKHLNNIARLLVVGAAMLLATVLARVGLLLQLGWGVWVSAALTLVAYWLYYHPGSARGSHDVLPIKLVPAARVV